MRQKLFLFFNLIAIICCFSIVGSAQRSIATSLNIESKVADGFSGILFITVGGKQKKISENARNAWIINGGKDVVYSWPNRERGFEGEGESLSIYNVSTAKTRTIMAESAMVTGLSETKLSNRAIALLVRLEDGALGAAYFAVVDPKRGQVLSQNFAELTEIKGDNVTLAFYQEQDWETINQGREWEHVKSQSAMAKSTKVKPERSTTLNLIEVLKNKVIYNKTNEEWGAEHESKYKDVAVYLWLPNEPPPKGENYFIMAVRKTIPAKDKMAPLGPTLKLLFDGADEQDKASGFESSTFGMKFEGVALANGVATVKFSQPRDQTNYGSLGPFIFVDAIEKTAKRFPTVKKVIVCAVGETLIDSQLETPFPRCK